ncbi:MAG: hypothetical protein WAR01_09145 [Dokdonella sp.]|mgnify:FL=1|uniref:hypothetical protein n=1 Tax=Dokdonella sp. TaxID=2291710 RepID=UPI002B8CE150|nr:hypothetical protein [Xanthomonadales bacterium]HQW75723.1 hypothetical protein [Dokdonella sp.]MBK7209792.1 hypothetical protein [Xanthomonadales bacterium]MBL0222450.1 hypothetical protein [Xanthomonadales bacterium]HQX64434.1 hypothetical protein [Dokdonella sp.]
MTVEVETTPAGELFPALELSQGERQGDDAGQGNGLLRIRLGDVRMPHDVRLTVSTEGLRHASVIETRISGDTVLRPRLAWDTEALLQLRQPRRQTLRVSVTARGMKMLEREVQLDVHPLDEAVYFVREGDARIDLGWAFAAWVDPQDPVVDHLLELAGIHAGESLPGDRQARLGLAQKLWVALEQRGLRYAEEGAGLSQGPVIYSQRVRLLSDTWNDRVANCLDGSVLIASALERLGIGSFLVLVPGHAFVGFYVDGERREAEFLETTLLGFRKPPGHDAESAAQVRQRALPGFEAARRAGRARYRKVVTKLDGRHRPDYALIDISTARAYGIMPLAVGRRGNTASAPVASSTPAVSARPERRLP